MLQWSGISCTSALLPALRCRRVRSSSWFCSRAKELHQVPRCSWRTSGVRSPPFVIANWVWVKTVNPKLAVFKFGSQNLNLEPPVESCSSFNFDSSPAGLTGGWLSPFLPHLAGSGLQGGSQSHRLLWPKSRTYAGEGGASNGHYGHHGLLFLVVFALKFVPGLSNGLSNCAWLSARAGISMTVRIQTWDKIEHLDALSHPAPLLPEEYLLSANKTDSLDLPSTGPTSSPSAAGNPLCWSCLCATALCILAAQPVAKKWCIDMYRNCTRRPVAWLLAKALGAAE